MYTSWKCCHWKCVVCKTLRSLHWLMWQSPLVMNRLIYCQKKLASKMGVLSRLRSFMSSELLQKNFNTIIFWHLYYCSTLWGNMKNKTSTSYMHFQSEPLGWFQTDNCIHLFQKWYSNWIGCLLPMTLSTEQSSLF